MAFVYRAHDLHKGDAASLHSMTPIERKLWDAFLMVHSINPAMGLVLPIPGLTFRVIRAALLDIRSIPKSVADSVLYAVAPQVCHGSRRLDFGLVSAIDGANRWYAVECDGHDFHERTKEQARSDKARDRELARDGIVTIRFAGSEIWKDAAECMNEIGRILGGDWQRQAEIEKFGEVRHG